MPSSLWEDIKRTVKEGVSVAAEKTEEYTKVGKVKVEILNIQRNLDKAYAELGEEVFGLFEKGKKTDVAESAKVKKLIAAVKEKKAELKKKEAEIETIKKDVASKTEARKSSETEEKPKTETPSTAAAKTAASKSTAAKKPAAGTTKKPATKTTKK